MAMRIQMRRGTAAEWTAANPVLATGEQGYETDTGKTKVGDGVTAWASLPYPVDEAAADAVDANPTIAEHDTRIKTGLAKTNGAVVVAASNASSVWAANADYVADGTDDDVQVQLAIDNATGDVILSDGTFNYTTTPRVPSNRTVRGQGAGRTFVVKTDGGKAFMEPATGIAENVILADMNVTGRISLYGAAHCHITRCIVHDATGSGIYLAGPDNRVTWCDVADIGVAGGSSGGESGIVFDTHTSAGAPERSFATGNTVQRVQEHGIKVYPGAHGSRIIGNYIEEAGLAEAESRAIYIQDGDDITVAHNVAVNCGMGIEVGVGVGAECNRVSVTGNVVDVVTAGHGILIRQAFDVTATGNVVLSSAGSGIFIDGADRVTITGNIVRGCGAGISTGRAGIHVSDSYSGTATGNLCVNNGNAGAASTSSGIYLLSNTAAATARWAVTGNTCYDDRGTKLQSYGVRISGPCEAMLVTHNVLSGNGTAGLLDGSGGGTGSVTTPNVTTGG